MIFEHLSIPNFYKSKYQSAGLDDFGKKRARRGNGRNTGYFYTAATVCHD